MNNTAIKFTYQDYLQMQEDNLRHEIIDGEHCVTPSPNIKHQNVSQNINRYLDRWIHDHQLGRLFTAPTDVILSNTDIVVPDLLFLSTARLSILTDKNVQGAPDLIIEILSSSTSKRDLGIKKKSYEKFRVEHYWIIDPDQKTVQTFHLQNDQYQLLNRLSANETLTSSLFSGLSIPLSSLFD